MSRPIVYPQPMRPVVCTICGALACCRIYGAICCSDCAKFFRHAVLLNKFYVCKGERIGCCNVIRSNHRMCRSCRLDKCYVAGMQTRYVYQPLMICRRCYDQPPIRCSVCYSMATGFFFGTYTCTSCASFFHYSTVTNAMYECKGVTVGECPIFLQSVATCYYCLLQRCYRMGMRPEVTVECQICDFFQRHGGSY